MQHMMFDHLMVLVLAMTMPVYAIWSYQRLEAKLSSGLTTKIKEYQQIMVLEWGLSAAILVLWLMTGRGSDVLGLHLDFGGWAWLGAGLTLGACVFLVVQLVTVSRDAEKLTSVREQSESLRAIIPGDAAEYRWFVAASITAGICEELLYRGFLMAYFAGYLGTVAAVLISSVIFGLGHSYQGPRGMLKTGVVGLFLAGLYVLTGSLWASIVLHAVLDVTSGLMAWRAFNREPLPA